MLAEVVSKKRELSELYFVAVWVGVIVWKRRVKLVRLLHLRHFIMKGFRIVFFSLVLNLRVMC